MASIDIWIASLIEHCFSARWSSSEVEDDGSNLRFPNNSQQFALINNRRESDGILSLNLTDLQTQIDAIMARESLQRYRTEFPDRSFKNDDIRGCVLQLLDFEVVLEYSMSQPKLHLYVLHFCIAWDRGQIKGPPQGRGIRKNPSLSKMMRTVFSEAKSRAETLQGTMSGSFRFLEPPLQTQPHDDSEAFISSQNQPLVSHPPRISALNHTPVLGSTSSNKLLGLLGPQSKVTDSNESPTGNETTARPAGGAVSSETEVAEQAQRSESEPVVNGNNGRTEVDDAHESAHVTVPDSASLDHNTNNTNPRHEDDSARASDVTETNEQREHSVGPSANVNRAPISEATAHFSPQKASTTRQPLHQSSGHSDPWYGMTRICKRDIRVPKNQAAFFEQHVRCWVPPLPGEREPQGHFPAPLLSQWNTIAYNRNRSIKENELNDSVSKPVDSPEPAPVSSSSAPQTSSESEDDQDEDQDGDDISWSNSPETPARRRKQLPADSSPAERNQPVAQTAGKSQSNIQSILENPQGQRASVDSASNKNAEKATEASAPEAQLMELEDDVPDQQESDKESQDSVMDTSIPCPLRGSSQARLSSQSEPESTSSGPSLAGYLQLEQVQVMETPTTNFNHSQTANRGNTKIGLDSSDSPFLVESSSQSRILNTYASNDTGTKNTQEMSYPSQGNDGSHEVDVMGTQLSNGDGPFQNSIPSPHSAVVVDSPGLGGSISVCQFNESSKLFSSHNEVLPSMQSGENGEDASEAPKSAQDPPIEHTQKSPLKRFMSYDAGEQSPAKRYKMLQENHEDIHAPIIRASTPNVISRRESYIGCSGNHAKAQRIYEKFRSDYPTYRGDFVHFTKRSFLWDDFIIKHLEEYPQHIEEALGMGMDVKSEAYEEYFASNVSRPSYKKRSLTADGIQAAASQNVSAAQPKGVPSPALPQPLENTSFTGSLVERFHSLHAQSTGLSTQGLQSEAHNGQASPSMSTPTSGSKTMWHTLFENHADAHQDRDEASHVADAAAVEPGQDTEILAAEEVDDDEIIDETQTADGIDRDEIVDETQGADEVDYDDEIMDETHETASIELGDREPGAPAEEPVAAPDVEPGDESEAESVNENWFDSLRHIRERGPTWSDDFNTPFKKWARADQNVLVERKRRGGARIPVDERGVIQRFHY
ncbi:hypothetical protein EYZ11_006078 [Aspergillus tanneri]|uniref:Telomere replication protein EST3 n=1 Tax=Aspergillus tanneri TaxID=1220188 RepID=A0A4S3JMB4_9EURO|nr:hypothetical protein EYZ11_006078 [Aspergillus tanneri]